MPAEPAEAELIRVAWIDDHKLLRDGVSGLFQGIRDIELQPFASRNEFLTALTESGPWQVVLVDLYLGYLKDVTAPYWGYELFEDIRSRQPNARIGVFTTYDSSENGVLARARDKDPDGYISKDEDVSEVAACIRQLHRQGSCMSPGISDAAKKLLARSVNVAVWNQLDAEMRDVLSRITEGPLQENLKQFRDRVGIGEKQWEGTYLKKLRGALSGQFPADTTITFDLIKLWAIQNNY